MYIDMHKGFPIILLAAGLLTLSARGANELQKKTMAQSEAREQRQILFKSLDLNDDRQLSADEVQKGCQSGQLRSPRIRPGKEPLTPDQVSSQLFLLLDTDHNNAADREEVEAALLAKVLVFKYVYVPTEEERMIYQAAKDEALKDEALDILWMRAEDLRKEAALQWDDSKLQAKARRATEKANDALEKKMKEIDPQVAPILDKMHKPKP